MSTLCIQSAPLQEDINNRCSFAFSNNNFNIQIEYNHSNFISQRMAVLLSSLLEDPDECPLFQTQDPDVECPLFQTQCEMQHYTGLMAMEIEDDFLTTKTEGGLVAMEIEC
jgi:hypothetical protein